MQTPQSPAREGCRTPRLKAGENPARSKTARETRNANGTTGCLEGGSSRRACWRDEEASTSWNDAGNKPMRTTSERPHAGWKKMLLESDWVKHSQRSEPETTKAEHVARACAGRVWGSLSSANRSQPKQSKSIRGVCEQGGSLTFAVWITASRTATHDRKRTSRPSYSSQDSSKLPDAQLKPTEYGLSATQLVCGGGSALHDPRRGRRHRSSGGGVARSTIRDTVGHTGRFGGGERVARPARRQELQGSPGNRQREAIAA